MDTQITIVMTIRENYSLTLQTIAELIKFTTLPYRFIFVDYNTPDFMMQEIKKNSFFLPPISSINISIKPSSLVSQNSTQLSGNGIIFSTTNGKFSFLAL